MDLAKLPIKFFLKPFTFAYYTNFHLRKWLLKYHPDNIQEGYEDSDDMFIEISYYRGTRIQVILFRKFYIRVQVRTTARHSVLKKKFIYDFVIRICCYFNKWFLVSRIRATPS